MEPQDLEYDSEEEPLLEEPILNNDTTTTKEPYVEILIILTQD